ncbi:MAG TPA: hypothetical protein PLZ12_06175 [Saprospiraceae bacterium]|nr:hypothetical protein [Saprospiraceae bacterium]
MKAILYSVCMTVVFISSCNLFGDDNSCVPPDEDHDTTVIVEVPGAGNGCTEVSEGYEISLRWPSAAGNKGTGRKFQFTNTDGFIIKEGESGNRDTPDITLIATARSPAAALISVFAYNDCGQSNVGQASVKVRRTPPFKVNSNIQLPQALAHAATFTHNGKGYIIGGAAEGTTGLAPAWVYTPAVNRLEQLPAVFSGSVESAAVVGDTVYVVGNGGREIQVGHIPSNTKVRTINHAIPHQDVLHNTVWAFSHGSKVYFGPVAPGAHIMSYDVATGDIATARSLTIAATQACRAAVFHNNSIHYFFAGGMAYTYNLEMSQPFSYFSAPAAGSTNAVTAFSVNNQAYLVTSDMYYAFNPSNRSFMRAEVFNGSDCFPTGWIGPTYSITNFVLNNRVYFFGGRSNPTGAGSTDFFGIQF